MIRQLMRLRRRRVLIDVDTQRDFLVFKGKMCIRNHRRILAHIRRVMACARSQHIPVISICQVNPNNNGGSELNYCLEGTPGQEKVSYTLLNKRVSFEADNNTHLPADILRQYRQIIFDKRSVDPFKEARIERLLSEIRVDEFVLIGTGAEDSVMATALGLLQRDKNVTVITDAVGFLDSSQAKLSFRKMEAKGAKLIDTKKFAGTSGLKQAGICRCNSCREILKQKPVHAY
ncbi:MAG: cysteine hydrolase family protein [Planctomycetota bacterium]|jgi:nicotinamidase-related amidase